MYNETWLIISASDVDLYKRVYADIGVGGIYRVPRTTPWSSKILGLSVSNTKAHDDYLEQHQGVS